MAGHTEYLIKPARRLWQGTRETYEVHKFDGKELPTDTYHVFRRDDGSLGCSCPAGSHHVTGCKHMAWVGKWLEMPDGKVYSVSPEGEFTELEGLTTKHVEAMARRLEREAKAKRSRT